jgi:hypothetical protein
MSVPVHLRPPSFVQRPAAAAAAIVVTIAIAAVIVVVSALVLNPAHLLLLPLQLLPSFVVICTCSCPVVPCCTCKVTMSVS